MTKAAYSMIYRSTSRCRVIIAALALVLLAGCSAEQQKFEHLGAPAPKAFPYIGEEEKESGLAPAVNYSDAEIKAFLNRYGISQIMAELPTGSVREMADPFAAIVSPLAAVWLNPEVYRDPVFRNNSSRDSITRFHEGILESLKRPELR